MLAILLIEVKIVDDLQIKGYIKYEIDTDPILGRHACIDLLFA